ncbi:hypothetical protein Glove_246g2 [Diversispora epigaea]|uniref:Uncharacterized protein n=1 Tax=Diversispora epigaea TaxID=1348612 RepID=A0A397IFD1_9GLOM|nr:hypothetical protein Glove_246g2 [Diversispora epigaea]
MTRIRRILKELEEETDKVLNEATAKSKGSRGDNVSEEDIRLSFQKNRKSKDSSSKTKSVDILSINKYKIETLNEYQQLCKHFEQQYSKHDNGDDNDGDDDSDDDDGDDGNDDEW